MLWQRTQAVFNSTCFEFVGFQEINDNSVELSFDYFIEQTNCQNLIVTNFGINNQNFRLNLPVNLHAPKIFDPSNKYSNRVKLSSCQSNISLIVEDLDGRNAALSPPEVYIQSGPNRIDFVLETGEDHKFEHGLMLFVGQLSNFDKKSDAVLYLRDNPISLGCKLSSYLNLYIF